MLKRIQIAWRARGLEKALRAISQREDAALARAGAQVFSGLRHGDAATGAGPSTDRLAVLVDRDAARAGALERSLALDRRDFAEASQLARWAVIGRGILDRAALRDRAKRDDRERTELERELGRLALDDAHPELRALVPKDRANEVALVRDEARVTREAIATLIEPYGGQPLPTGLAVTLREIQNFLGFVWDQLSKRLFLRAPALAGLLVGWWLGQRFSDSAIVAWAHEHIGLDLRGTSEKRWHETLSFWLPLFAAALCSYVGWVIAGRAQHKYASPDEAP